MWSIVLLRIGKTPVLKRFAEFISVKNQPVLVVGDVYLAAERFRALAEEFLKRHPGASTQTFFLKETPLGNILSQARTLPFGAEAQIFRVSEVDLLNADDAETLKAYLAKPPAYTKMVFLTDRLPEKGAVSEIFKDHAEIIRLEKSDLQDASHQLIKKMLTDEGKRMSGAAIRRICEKAGDHPGHIDTLIKQLVQYAGDAGEISDEMARQFEEDLTAVDMDRLLDAITTRRLDLSLSLFNRFLEENNRDFIMFIGLVHWRLRTLWQVSTLLEEGMPEASIQKTLKLYYGKVKPLCQQARSIGRARIERALEGLFQLDWACKSGRAEPRSGFERWLAEAAA